MILWRISNHTRLDGERGLRAPGRWHTRGQRIVYCAQSPAAALLEVLVHAEIDIEDLPATFRYLGIDAPDSAGVEEVDIPSLGPHSKQDLAITRRVGNDWLRAAQSPLLRVPSVIVPETWNVLLNPRHQEAGRVRILRAHTHPIDPHLLA